MFSSIDLARRIEASGCIMLAGLAQGPDYFTVPVGGGSAIFAGADTPMTKVFGIGFEGPVPDDQLDAVEAAWDERGAPVAVELATLSEQGVAAALCRRGYVLVGFEDVLGLSLRDLVLPPPPASVEVRRSGPEELERFVDISVEGFSSPDTEGVASHESFPAEAMRGVMARVAPHADRFIALRDGIEAAAASLAIAEGVAWLNGSTTLRSHRRRGLQTALVHARLAAAAEAGADLATITVSPGTKSKQNAERRGFQLLYTRAILVREPPP